MKVAVIGAGYVGLVTGACLSELGCDVICIDRDAEKIEQLSRGKIPIFEPGLDALVLSNVAARRLSFGTSASSAVRISGFVFLAVGTPTTPATGEADLSQIFSAADRIADSLNEYKLIVTKSTVPVGTGKRIESAIRQVNPLASFDVVSNPEFLREGSAINDFMNADRVVIGASSQIARGIMEDLYAPLAKRGTRVLCTSIETSEMIKYAANSFLATKISFINEIADLCEKLGADVADVAEGMGLDHRICRAFLDAGPGYGGSCFPKDCRALIRTARDAGVPLRIVGAAAEVNELRKKSLVHRVLEACSGTVQGKKIAVLGLTFKPDTDDMREAPSLELIPALQDAGAVVAAHDPEGIAAAAQLMPTVVYGTELHDAVRGADAIVLLTGWEEYKSMDLTRILHLMSGRHFIDFRNLFLPEAMARHGFDYIGIGGRSSEQPTENIQVAA